MIYRPGDTWIKKDGKAYSISLINLEDSRRKIYDWRLLKINSSHEEHGHARTPVLPLRY